MADQLESAAYYHIAYEPHSIMNPLSDERFLLLARQCGLDRNSRVLDIGSGNGWSSYLLCREFGCHSTQIDISEQWTARARLLFSREGLSTHTDIHCMDAASFFCEDNAYDLVLCLGTALLYEGFGPALDVFARTIRRNGCIIIGELSAEPPLPKRYKDYLASFDWDMTGSRTLLRAIDDRGLELLWALRSTPDEWDRYMSMQWKAVSDRARAHPDDAQLQEFLDWARDEQETYLRYQRHHVDWNVFLLRRLGD
ncbi:MAG: class I SAM-dependent methyltransferase [Bacteroidetes bacterium]|nr:class I SAM-dependent methyltransferase [Bacteroidota bacterium]